MSRFDCRRCDWRPVKDDDSPGPLSQLADHAQEEGHWLCRCCGLSLPPSSVAVCVACVADARQRLYAIVDTYALLPDYLATVPSPSDWRRSGPRGDEAPMPGGDALVLRAYGSQGRSQIRGVPMPDGSRNFDHEADELTSDAPSIAYELGQWEDDWRREIGDGAAPYDATVTSAAHYLNRHLQWAADHLQQFDEFADDLKRLLARLEVTTATDEREDVGAACQDCGSDLRRAYDEPKPCHHERPTQECLVVGWFEPPEPDAEKVPIRETTLERDARLSIWAEQHAHCEQGGQTEVWRCPNPHCPRDRYTQEEYRLALAMSMRVKRDDAHHWVPVAVAARLVDRTQAVIKRWAEVETWEPDKAEPVLMACDVKTRRLRVLLSTVFRANDHRQRRRKRAA